MDQVSGVPRWVRVFLLVTLAVVVLGVVVMLLVGGDHGPGRHSSAKAFDMVVSWSAQRGLT